MMRGDIGGQLSDMDLVRVALKDGAELGLTLDDACRMALNADSPRSFALALNMLATVSPPPSRNLENYSSLSDADLQLEVARLNDLVANHYRLSPDQKAKLQDDTTAVSVEIMNRSAAIKREICKIRDSKNEKAIALRNYPKLVDMLDRATDGWQKSLKDVDNLGRIIKEQSEVIARIETQMNVTSLSPARKAVYTLGILIGTVLVVVLAAIALTAIAGALLAIYQAWGI